jgi:hypothetical protein
MKAKEKFEEATNYLMVGYGTTFITQKIDLFRDSAEKLKEAYETREREIKDAIDKFDFYSLQDGEKLKQKLFGDDVMMI